MTITVDPLHIRVTLRSAHVALHPLSMRYSYLGKILSETLEQINSKEEEIAQLRVVENNIRMEQEEVKDAYDELMQVINNEAVRQQQVTEDFSEPKNSEGDF